MQLARRWQSTFWQVTLWLLLAALAGCGSAPQRATGGPGGPAVSVRPGPAPSGERDGPDATPPSDLASVPDAEPRIEPIRNGGPNKPYEALGRDYVPITEDKPFAERGLASWYGKKFHGRRTASGEPYNMYAMTAAHPTLPIPSYVRVRNPANSREVVVRVNDRGPFHPGRVIDLSYTAAYKLGLLRGVAPVELSRITFDEIRAGTWRKDAPPEVPADRNSLPELALFKRTPAEGTAATAATTTAMVTPATGAVTAATTAAASIAGAARPPLVTPPAPPSLALPPAAEASAPPPSAPASDAIVASATPRPSPGFWVQLGVFRQREGADGFQRRVVADLDWLAPLLAVFSEPTSYRLQAGPYASRDEAQGVAKRVREALNLVPVIVERR
jgi:rare lipoprotein A